MGDTKKARKENRSTKLFFSLLLLLLSLSLLGKLEIDWCV